MTPEEKLDEARRYVVGMRGTDLTADQDAALVELAEIVAKGRDDRETTNYAYLTWQRVMELAEVLGVLPLKTVLYLEGLEKRCPTTMRSLRSERLRHALWASVRARSS